MDQSKKAVIMYMECEPIYPYLDEEAINSVSIENFVFEVKGNDIYFDFNAYSSRIEEEDYGIIIQWESGKGPLFNNDDISDVYVEEYEKIGLTKEMITAEFLSSTTCIKEIHYDIRDQEDNPVFIKVKDIIFANECGVMIRVDPLVIARFNMQHLLENQEEIKKQLYGGK